MGFTLDNGKVSAANMAEVSAGGPPPSPQPWAEKTPFCADCPDSSGTLPF